MSVTNPSLTSPATTPKQSLKRPQSAASPHSSRKKQKTLTPPKAKDDKSSSLPPPLGNSDSDTDSESLPHFFKLLSYSFILLVPEAAKLGANVIFKAFKQGPGASHKSSGDMKGNRSDAPQTSGI